MNAFGRRLGGPTFPAMTNEPPRILTGAVGWAVRSLWRLWALFAGIIAIGAAVGGDWPVLVALITHATLIWPEVTMFARDRGVAMIRVFLAWGTLAASIALLAFSPGSQKPTAPLPVAAGPREASPRPATATSLAPADPQPARPSPSIATQAANDDLKFARLIILGRRTMDTALRDSSSARYRNVRLMSMPGTNGALFCGEVNARNAYGGYVGYHRFISVPGAQAWTDEIDGFATTWADVCRPSRVMKSAPAF